MVGAGIATRSYLFVEDVAAAFDCVLHKGITGEVYNIGTQKERTVIDVARDIAPDIQATRGQDPARAGPRFQRPVSPCCASPRDCPLQGGLPDSRNCAWQR